MNVSDEPIFTARSSYASAVLGIVILSVCPSVCHTRALWQNKRTYRHILIPHERVITLVFWYQQRLVGDIPSPWNLRLKWPTPFEKCWLQPISAYNIWTVRASKKCSIIANRKLTTHFPTSYRWSMYITPNIPKGWFRKRICLFLWIKFTFNRTKAATKCLCVKTSSGKVVEEPFPYLMVYRSWR